MMESEKNIPSQYKTGLVLSGGAYRGAGQLGVLKALLERGIKPDVVSGTSAGALNAVFYSSGYSPDEIFEIWKKEPFAQLLDFHLPKFGFLKPTKIEGLIKPYLKYVLLEELPLPVFVTTACLNTGKQAIFNKGNIIQLLEASCAVPVIFEPVEIDGRQHVDGGLVSNLPVEPLRDICEFVIGVSVNPIPEKERLDGLKEIIYRTIWMGMEGSVQKTQEMCDWFISPPEMGKHGFVERSALNIFFQAGYEYTIQFLLDKGR